MRRISLPFARVAVLASLAAFTLAATPKSEPPTALDASGNMVLGYARAPVVVEEYASVGCPHCAVWAATNWNGFKTRFVDTGRARFVLHEMLTGDGRLAAAGFLIARCSGPAHYFQVVEEVYTRQADLEREGGPVLLAIAKAAGLTEDKADACLKDEAALKALAERAQKDPEARKVNATPTFFVDGKRLEEPPDLQALAADIAPLSVGRPATRARE